MSGRYNIENLLKILREPVYIRAAFAEMWNDLRKLTRKKAESLLYSNQYTDTETDIIDKDYDNLLILDACRYDYLTKIYDGDGQKVTSVAGNSANFIQKSMNGKELHDTVYISSNPYTDMTLNEGVFHRVIKTYDGTWKKGAYNDHTKYHPENVFNIAKSHIEKFNDKRIIVHFMQPHGPYFGEKAKEIRKKLMSEENISFTRLEDGPSNPDKTYPDLMHAASYGYLSSEDVQTVYEENLKMVLNYALQLQKLLEGKTVISADHGENLGNPSTYFSADYGHGGYSPEVREVPWVELEYETRKNVRRARPVKSNEVDEEVVIEQLESLGYME